MGWDCCCVFPTRFQAKPWELSSEWESAAEYTLEMPARCPHCRALIHTLRVVRLTRSKVTFTSPLPRGGRVLVCPLCERIISAELSGIL